MTIELYRGDLPAGLKLGPVVAVDTETMGLNPVRDRLCLVQLSQGDGICHLVQIAKPPKGQRASAPNLKALLEDRNVLKLFHFARFDSECAQGQSRYRLRAGLLHQDRGQAGAHLHRPARP